MTTTTLAAPLSESQTMDRLDAAVDASDADQLDIAVLARAGEYTRFAGTTIHQPQDILEVQYLVRAIVDGHAFRASTTVAAHLDRVVAQAVRGARERSAAAGSTGSNTIADVTGEPGPLRLWFDDGFDAATRVALARRAMVSAVARGGEAAGMFGRAVTQQLVATSNGARRATSATEASGALTITVDDGTSHWVDVSRSARRLGCDAAVSESVEQAVASRGRQTLAPGSYPVVLGAEAVGELLQFLPDLGFSGQLAAAGIGLPATRAGEHVAATLVTVADDAAADVGLPIGFDLEGVTKQRVPFFESGRVGRPVTDTATATPGTASTGHAHIAREQVPEPAAANIVMAAGSGSEADLIAGIDRGVYVQRFWYTRLVDRVAGTITGVTRDACFLIEGGRLTTPLQGMRFTESVVDCLAAVDAVGSDVRSQPVMNVWNGVTSAPAVRVASFRLGAAPIDRGTS